MNVYITPKDYAIAKKNGIDESTLNQRVYTRKWDKKRALTQPKRERARNCRWARIAVKNGINRQTFHMRVQRGMSPEEASRREVRR